MIEDYSLRVSKAAQTFLEVLVNWVSKAVQNFLRILVTPGF
jgi:hypothetical protein